MNQRTEQQRAAAIRAFSRGIKDLMEQNPQISRQEALVALSKRSPAVYAEYLRATHKGYRPLPHN